MSELIGQISMFSILDEYETPFIPVEEQKKGVKGWIINFSGIFLRENGFKEDWHGVETRQIVFNADTKKDKYGKMWQDAKTIKGPSMGWMGSVKPVFKTRLTWNDCLTWARKNMHKDDPEDVRYFSHKGDWTGIYRYEEGA